MKTTIIKSIIYICLRLRLQNIILLSSLIALWITMRIFLIYSGNAQDISLLFQRLNGAFSNYYNKMKDRVGYVFRDRFLSQEIYDNTQLVNCIKYIHNNPVKANMVNMAKEYLFSSYKEFENRTSNIIDFNIISPILNRLQNVNCIFDKNYDEKQSFIDLKDFNRDKFYKEYLPQLNIELMKKNKNQLKEEIIKCVNEMDVPVKELVKAFDISLNTIYLWLKK